MAMGNIHLHFSILALEYITYNNVKYNVINFYPTKYFNTIIRPYIERPHLVNTRSVNCRKYKMSEYIFIMLCLTNLSNINLCSYFSALEAESWQKRYYVG